MADEVLRALERSAEGAEDEERLLRVRVRRGALALGFAEEAARLGYPPARRLFAPPPPVRTPSLETLRSLGPGAWVQLFLHDALGLLPLWEQAYPEDAELRRGLEAVQTWAREPTRLDRAEARRAQRFAAEQAVGHLSLSGRLLRCALSTSDALRVLLAASHAAASHEVEAHQQETLWRELAERDALARLDARQRAALVPFVLWPEPGVPAPPSSLVLVGGATLPAPSEPEGAALCRARVGQGLTTRKALRLAARLGDRGAAAACAQPPGAAPETAQQLVHTLAALRAFAPSAWPTALLGALPAGRTGSALARAREALSELLLLLSGPERSGTWERSRPWPKPSRRRRAPRPGPAAHAPAGAARGMRRPRT